MQAKGILIKTKETLFFEGVCGVRIEEREGRCVVTFSGLVHGREFDLVVSTDPDVMEGAIDRHVSDIRAAEDVQSQWEAEAKALPFETRQTILDLLREGYSVGEIGRDVNVEAVIVGTVIVQNTEDGILRKNAKTDGELETIGGAD